MAGKSVAYATARPLKYTPAIYQDLRVQMANLCVLLVLVLCLIRQGYIHKRNNRNNNKNKRSVKMIKKFYQKIYAYGIHRKKRLSHNVFFSFSQSLFTTSLSQRLSLNVFLTTSFSQRLSHNVFFSHNFNIWSYNAIQNVHV